MDRDVFDVNGRIIEEHYLLNEMSGKVIKYYAADGKLENLYSDFVIEENEVNDIHLYYNADRELIEFELKRPDQPEASRSIAYSDHVYDDYGNWISRVSSEEGIEKIETRIFTYYK